MTRSSFSKTVKMCLMTGLFGCAAAGAHAQSGGSGAAIPINGADSAFVFACAALVLLMTPGLAFFYCGMVRGKNVLGTIMHSLTAMAVLSLQWVLIGYTLAFGPDIGGFIGGLAHIGFRGVGFEALSAKVPIPHSLFAMYQGMFAVITPALIAGAMAERIKFKTYIVFILLWSTLVYDPVCHWIWGPDGWLNGKTLDFAGGLVVHMSSGLTALLVALMLGRRNGFPSEQLAPHNLPFTVLGTGLLWFGWFGFNAGSGLGINEAAMTAFVATNTAAAAGAVTWMVLDWITVKKPTALGTASGAVAGLATVTQAAGYVSPLAALAIGVMAGTICRFVVRWRTRKGIDDSLDAFGVHGVGGFVGALCVGLFASVGATGLIYGNAGQFMNQLKGILAVGAYTAVVSFVLLKILGATMGLRVDERDEFQGLDLSQHGEVGYSE